MRDDIKAGRLIEVLAHTGTQDEEEIHALYLGSKQTPRRVRVFLDFVVPRLQAYLRA